MGNLSKNINRIISSLEKDNDSFKINKRANEVKDMWEACVDKMFLDHTNAVFIIKKQETKTLIVYVDESLFAAELNAQRERIRLKFLELFNEDIKEFKILISRGRYKKNYPFKKDELYSYKDKTPSIPLSSEENNTIDEMISRIENPLLKNQIKQAMKTSLEWEKGKRYAERNKDGKVDDL